jgi:DNA repair exonuclease SbcCD nuclease subunit
MSIAKKTMGLRQSFEPVATPSMNAAHPTQPLESMPRFLHTADWQIGRLFASFERDNAALLVEARIQVVESLSRLATEHQVDAVLVSGDVFDAQTVSERFIRRLFNALGGYSGPWLMISGNHDAALAESVWTRAQRLGVVPAHAHLLLRPEVGLFEAQGFAVLPAPLTQRHTYEDLTQWFDAADTPSGLLRIGLAHGCVEGLLDDHIDSANPIARHRSASARLDYLALGDWHGTRILDPRTAYSGTPEPDRFKSNEAGQALLVEIDAPGSEPRITPLVTRQFHWKTLTRHCQVETDVDELITALQTIAPNEVVSLQVSGVVGLAAQQRLQQAIGAAEARARHLQVDLSELRLAPSDEDIAALQADGYVAEVVAELRQTIREQGEGAALAQDSLSLLATTLLQHRPQTATRSPEVQT